MMSLAAWASACHGELLGEDCAFTKVSTDTRTLERGDVFLAIKGEHFDGHACIADALSKGAVACVVNAATNDEGITLAQEAGITVLKVDDTVKAYGTLANLVRQTFAAPVIGLTGSGGKTTVKAMIAAIGAPSEAHTGCIATEGNFNNFIGVPLTLLRLADAAQAEFAVIEAGTNSQGEIAYLTDLIQPNVALVNNVMDAHMAGFGTIEAIAREKACLYSHSAADTLCILNADDAQCETLGEHIGERPFACFTQDAANAEFIIREGACFVVFPQLVSVNAVGCAEFDLVIADSQNARTLSSHIQLAMPGLHNMANALAAAAAAYAVGCDIDRITQGLTLFAGVKGRMQMKEGEQGCVVIDDTYNANPGAFRAAIDYLAAYPNSILVCGDIGELGENAARYHADVGAYAKQKQIHTVLATGDLSRHIVEAFGSPEYFFTDQQEVIRTLKALITPESVVLVKGSRSAKMEHVVDAICVAPSIKTPAEGNSDLARAIMAELSGGDSAC